MPLPKRVDLTTITATDARSATVTTADGRRFRTDDRAAPGALEPFDSLPFHGISLRTGLNSSCKKS